jgi:hypothetical protein
MHIADLFAARNEGSIEWRSVEEYLRGDCDLAEGLSVGEEAITALRRQALALMKTGKWSRAADVVLGVSALGSVHPADALILARCDRALGEEHRAGQIARRLMRAMEIDREELALDLDEVPAIELSEAREFWEEARRLSSAVESVRACCQARQHGSDPEAVARALESAGMCEAVAMFPAAQLNVLVERTRVKVEPSRRPLLRRSDRFDAPSELGRILGDVALGESLRGTPHLDALVVMIDQASSAPDYSMVRTGEFHPGSREGYRLRLHGSMSLYLSEGRHEDSHGEAHRLAREIAKGRSIEDAIVSGFVREIGAHEKHARAWSPTFAAVLAAIDAEALFALRALSETVQDMADADPERGYAFYRATVSSIVKRTLEGSLDPEALWSAPFDREPHVLVQEMSKWSA